MANYNRVIVMGNLTRDPELTYTPAGQPVCKVGLAVNERWTDKAGQKVEKVHFFDITAWAKTAELISQYLKKGSSALFEGKLAQDRWEDQNTQQKRSKVYIVAERVQFVGGKPDGGAQEGAPAQSDAPGEEVPF